MNIGNKGKSITSGFTHNLDTLKKGVYKDNEENRGKNRVGQKYGGKGENSSSKPKREEREKFQLSSQLKELEKYGVRFIIGSSKVSPISKIEVPVNMSDSTYKEIRTTLINNNLQHLRVPVKERS